MTRSELSETNARFFPDDSEWQKHCAKLAAYLNSIPPIIPDDLIRDTLHSGISDEHARNVLNGDV